jgi:predicted O-linked N-acetylglucosamine transferase (SPINDLY family)
MNPASRAKRAHQHWQAGVAQAKTQQWQRAIQEFEQATRLQPGDSVYWLNLARARMGLGQWEAAIEAGRHAMQLDPASALTRRACAECLAALHRYDEAAACFDNLPPDAAVDFEHHSAHGNALFQAHKPREAIEAFFRALAIKLDAPLIHYRMGLCFMDLTMKEEASECLRTAAALDSGVIRAMALAVLAYESRQACQWGNQAEETQALREAIANAGESQGQLLAPFALLAVDCTPAEQRRVGELRSNWLARGVRPLPRRSVRKEGKVRIGYLSGDIYLHATAVLMAELLERRDRSRFEVFMYSHSRDDGSRMRQRVIEACDHFIDVTHLTNGAIAQRMQADGIDIAIDLKGHTRDSRYEVLASRPAPVQVSYLGFPGTTGAGFIDYVIGDPVVTPLQHAQDFTERIAQLPWSYQPNDRQRALPPKPERAEHGLPQDALVLCCFNQAYKITPQVLGLWVEMLQRIPNAVLWMLAWNPQARRNLVAELARRGIGEERIVFGVKLPLDKHLARLRCADLFLDTWPCNAHTTASEALWAGVPVVTVPGPTFASRVAASLLRACRLDELVCESAEDYVNKVVALSNDLPRLRALQRHLDEQRMDLPLFDTDRYARDYEALLLRMVERARQGLSPEALPAVASLDAPLPDA